MDVAGSERKVDQARLNHERVSSRASNRHLLRGKNLQKPLYDLSQLSYFSLPAQEMKIPSSGALAIVLSLSLSFNVEGALLDEMDPGKGRPWLSWCGKHYEVSSSVLRRLRGSTVEEKLSKEAVEVELVLLRPSSVSSPLSD